jgi:TatD DNase family protein
LRARQQHFYQEQLKLARKHSLPVVLHSRRAVDQVLAGLRTVSSVGEAWRGIAHAFNGSAQQAQIGIDLGLKLGFGGALTYSRALHLRRMAVSLPLDAIVLETDSPDMPPHWLYRTVAQRADGKPQGINSPTELPRIGAVLADLRGISVQALATATSHNALAALPKLAGLIPRRQNAW